MRRNLDTAALITYIISRRQRELAASLDPLKQTILRVGIALSKGKATLNPEVCNFTIELLNRIAEADNRLEADLLMLAGRLRRQDDHAANSYLT